MDLGYLVELDPVYRVLCGYLRTSDCLRLRHVSKTFQELVTSNPNTWKRLDFTGGTKDVITYYLNNDVVPGALRELTLDCSDVSEMTVAVILMRCPNLRHLGLGGCTELMEGLLLAVLSARKNGHAQKLLSVGLLGAPHFKSTGVNAIAASVARDFAAVGITTDLMSCPEEHAFTSDPQNQWHLCAERAARCTACGQHARGCYPCINSRTCRGCFKFWCFGCTSPITRVCYECGHSCADCKQGIYIKCKECGSMFCNLHRANDSFTTTSIAHTGRTQRTHVDPTEESCDWCIQGRCQGYGH